MRAFLAVPWTELPRICVAGRWLRHVRLASCVVTTLCDETHNLARLRKSTGFELGVHQHIIDANIEDSAATFDKLYIRRITLFQLFSQTGSTW